MLTPTTPQRPLAELLIELEAAVRAGDRDRATTLERAILQRLAAEAADRAAVGPRVRELVAELGLAGTIGAGPEGLESFGFEKSSTPRGAEGVVYPVWFGTNRKPSPAGGGFTGERHDRVTLGRVEVYVPEA